MPSRLLLVGLCILGFGLASCARPSILPVAGGGGGGGAPSTTGQFGGTLVTPAPTPFIAAPAAGPYPVQPSPSPTPFPNPVLPQTAPGDLQTRTSP